MELFKITLSICDTFKGVTPFSLRKENADEVFLLMRKLKKFGKQQQTLSAPAIKNNARRVTPDTANWW